MRVGNQANNFNGGRPGLGPVAGLRALHVPPRHAGAPCLPISPPGQNLWPKAKLSDEGFEDEQKFDNVYLLDAYRVRHVRRRRFEPATAPRQPGDQLGRERVHPGRQPDQPDRRPGRAARGCRAQGNPAAGLGGLRELGLQLRFRRGVLPAAVEQHVGRRLRPVLHAFPARRSRATRASAAASRWSAARTATSCPARRRRSSRSSVRSRSCRAMVPTCRRPRAEDASDSGQFGIAFRFPIDKIDTEIGVYAMNIHSRLPMTSSRTRHEPERPAGSDQGCAVGGRA